MKIFIDADACPSREKIVALAVRYQIPIRIYCDMSHAITSSYADIIICDTGYQSVDSKIVNELSNQDLLITQDYGLATIALAKGAFVFHPTGFQFENEKIDMMMEIRHQNGKLRRSGIHTKGPRKRTRKEEELLLTNLEKILRNL